MSSQLIASFTVLTPWFFQANQQGILVVLITGVTCSAVGLWAIRSDLEALQALFNRREGLLFATPILLVVLDILLTLIGINKGMGIIELNPFVASAIGVAGIALPTFMICYIQLSEGLGLLMLDFGQRIFARSLKLANLPFCLVCGAAALGPFSNIALLAAQIAGSLAFLVGLIGAIGLSTFLWYRLGRSQVSSI